jgi:hypothetical protein
LLLAFCIRTFGVAVEEVLVGLDGVLLLRGLPGGQFPLEDLQTGLGLIVVAALGIFAQEFLINPKKEPLAEPVLCMAVLAINYSLNITIR